MKNHTHNLKNFLLYLILVFSSVLTNAQTYSVKHAPIGGGGYVTGVVTHQTSGDIYCRTDVGGAYRWDAATSKWVPLLDWISQDDSNFSAVEALALDPQNANNVYMLCGLLDKDFGKTAILKSTDKGNTFTVVDVSSKFKAHGNGIGRSNGERLTVDPHNSNVLFCGTRRNGLWKSTDAGITWNLAWNGVTTTSNDNGICFVVYDPLSSVVNGVTQTMYIGVSRTGSANIYKSTDGGATFTTISATTSFMPHRAALVGTTMYVAYADAAGPYGVNTGGIYKLNTSTGTWTNVTPNANNFSYGSVCVDPSNANRVVVTTINNYNNNQYGTIGGDFVYLSTDGGTNWTLKNGSNSTYNNDGIGWTDGRLHWAGSIEFTPGNTAEVRVVSGKGLFSCSNINAANPSWKVDVRGMEEAGLTDGISIPGAPFISTLGDITGFVHNDLTSYPESTLQPAGGSNWGIDYAAANTSKLVRTTNGDDDASYVYYSTNQGSTWTAYSTTKGAAGKVAMSADGVAILHSPRGSSTIWRTTNNGGSWTSVSGVAILNAIPVADRVNSNYFYIHNASNGQMLVSSDKGASFSVAGTPGGTSMSWVPTYIRTVPGYEGHVWVPLIGNGLKYSTDHGATYTTVSNVTYCSAVGIGKADVSAAYPTVFIWGTVGGVNGLFRSTDKGANWVRMNDDAHEFGGSFLLIGDLNVFGRVYMWGTLGRGLIYWEPAACTPKANNPYVQINGGSWQQIATATLAPGGTVKFGPQPVVEGSWSWSGPNNFSAATREVTISNILASGAGDYVATYTNSGGCQSTVIFTVTVTGSVLREYWTGTNGSTINSLTSNANYPNSPTGSEQLTSLEGPTNWNDNYGTRIRGYVHPSSSGTYTFWVAGDDDTELYLSTSDNPSSKTRIAYVNGWTNSREWGKYSTQQSASVSLTAGQKYYIEVLHKDAVGGDNVAVAWQGPGITQQVIAGSYLSPYVPGTMVVRARGTQGGETIDLRINGNTVATWTLTTSFANYTAAGIGTVEVHFTNDNGARDVQVDYVTIDGVTYQSENQYTNTGVWQNSSCGGSNSEWLNCGGYIRFVTPDSSSGKIISTKSEILLSDTGEVTNDIYIYPNPALQGRFTLVLPEVEGNATVNIFDYQGKMLYEKITDGTRKLEIESGLKAGIYIVIVRTEESNFVRKLIVR